MIDRCAWLPCRVTTKTGRLVWHNGRKFCDRHYRLLNHVHCIACHICMIGHFGDLCFRCSKEWVWVAKGGYYERVDERISFSGERTSGHK